MNKVSETNWYLILENNCCVVFIDRNNPDNDVDVCFVGECSNHLLIMHC